MRRRLAVLAAAAAVAAADVAAVGHGVGDPAPAAPVLHASTTRSATDDAQVAIDALLRQRAYDVEHRDLAAYTTLLDPAAPAFVAQQRAELVALAQLPLGQVAYTADAASAATRGRVGRYGAAPTYAPTVTFSYVLTGFDASPVTATEVDTFVERNGRWLFTSDSDFGAPAPQIWRDGPLHVVRGARSLVVAEDATQAVAPSVAAEVDRDIPAVTAIWGSDWPQTAVVLLPATQAELGTLIGEGGDLSQIAAVESAEVGGDQGAGARIAVNPQPYASLSPLGRQVVVTHELTHVASRGSTTTSTPLWLVEGFADYVGFARSDLPPPRVASELQTRLRTGFAPTALPADGAFGPQAPDLATAYEQAWLACRLVAEKAGPAGLVALYRQVGAAGTPAATAVDDGLRAVLHEDTAAFTKEWVAYVHAQLT